MKTMKTLTTAIVLVAVTTGCASGVKRNASVDSFQEYQMGQFQLAANNLEMDLGLVDEQGALSDVVATDKAVLAHLEAGEHWRMAGNFERSTAHFDAVEELFKDEDTEGVGAKAGEAVGSALVNDKVRSYEPSPSERIVTNYYKALSFWSAGDDSGARIEFNRAQDRARIAVEAYGADIAKAKAEAEKSKQGIASSTESLLQETSDWEVFDDFINPGVTYANALFLAKSSNNEFDKAQYLLTRVEGMIGTNDILESDLSALREGTFGQKKYVWILMETGLSPYLSERRIDIPFTIDGKLMVGSIALPELVERPNTLTPAHVTFDGVSIDSVVIGDMGKIMRTEFKARWPGVVTRAAIGAVTKLALQNEVNKRNAYAGMFASIMSAALTQADVRYWQMMPATWRLAKYEVTGNNQIQIPYGNGAIETVAVDSDASSLIYIKQPTIMAKPLVEVLGL